MEASLMSVTPNLLELPVLILKEGSTRERGKGAQHANIMAAQSIQVNATVFKIG